MSAKMRVSAILSSYNYGTFLRESVECIVKQTRKPDEIIIVDDASSDCSTEVLATLAKEYPELIIIRHDRNQGVNLVTRTGLSRATGDYIIGLAADDPLLPAFVEKAMGVYAIHPDAGFCSGEHQIVYPIESGQLPVPITIGLAERPRFFSPPMLAEVYRARTYCSIPTSPAIWRRTALDEAGGFRDDLEWLSDWFAALVVASRHGYGYIPGIYQSIRYSPRSYSAAGMTHRDRFSHLMLKLLSVLDEPRYADVQPFFHIPAVLSRFGFRLLNILINQPKYHGYLSTNLFKAMCACENLGTDMDVAPLKGLSSSQLAEAFRTVLQSYADTMTTGAQNCVLEGRIVDAVAACNKALDAAPQHADATEMLMNLETGLERERAETQVSVRN